MTKTLPNGVAIVDGDSPATLQGLAYGSQVDALFGARQSQSFIWANSTERGAQTGMRHGDTGFQKDTNGRYYYDGTIWAGDSGWVKPTLLNSWVEANSPTEPVDYRLLNGVIYMRGRLALGSTGPAFNLPLGFRPASMKRYIVPSAAATTPVMVTVNPNGNVEMVSGTQPNLPGVIFPVDS